MKRGFLFLNVGTKYDDRLIVAVGSLRDFHDEPVHIMTDSYDNRGVKECLKRFEDVSVGIVDVPKKRNAAYVFKSSMWRHTPFLETIYLDADVLVVGDLSPLWTNHITLTSFGNWNSFGGIIGGRIRSCEKLFPDLVRKALSKPYAAINTGCLSWGHGSGQIMKEWEEMTHALGGFIADEKIFQLLHSKYDIPALDDRFNASPKFAHAKEDLRCLHGHGDKNRIGLMKIPWEKKANELGIKFDAS